MKATVKLILFPDVWDEPWQDVELNIINIIHRIGRKKI